MEENQLSAAEAELYDRQIRLWGIESQEKLRAADVLMVGIRGLGSEISKNILLSGINSLTILEDGVVTAEDKLQNFLLNSDSKIGNKLADEVLLKAQALNPLVKIVTDTSAISSKSDKFFKTFTIVVATGIKYETVVQIDEICRDNGVKFIYGDSFGMFGFSVADLNEHSYFEDHVQLQANRKRAHDGEKKTVRVRGNINYPPMQKVLILPNTKQDLKTIKKLARPNHLFFCMIILIEFRRRKNRSPDIKTKSQDVEELKNIAIEIFEMSHVSHVSLDQLYNLLFGEVAPVNAILGGVIAQEVIKAVSHKEVPINNVFLFDPITYSGKELAVGV